MQSGYLLRKHYRIEKRIGAGGFGETYLATDENPDYPIPRQVVVKHLKPSSNDPASLKVAVECFAKEARILAELGDNTDLIPTLYAYFSERDEFYIVQEFIEGYTLTSELDGHNLSETKTLKIVQDILIGLEIVHSNGVIHRDLKPDNIIRRATNKKLTIVDFGAIKLIRQGNNAQISRSIGIGTPGYMPTEQGMGHPRFASDVYAVGAIALQCLTGQHPGNLIDPDILEFRWRHLCKVDNRTVQVLDKMTAARYDRRYANATEAKQAIDRLIASINQPYQPYQSPRPPRPQFKPLVRTIVAPKPIARRNLLKWLMFGWAGATVSSILWQLFSEPFKPEILDSMIESSPDPEPIIEPLPAPEPLSSKPKSPLPRLNTIQFASVQLNDKGNIIARPKAQVQVYKEDLGNGVNLIMVKIPAGSFIMGSPESEEGRIIDESPQHLVSLKEFYIGQTEITCSQYQAIMDTDSSEYESNEPVKNVNWHKSKEFCQKLSSTTGRTYTLPSESQWEYACRAGTTTPFAFGETITNEVANCGDVAAYKNELRGIEQGTITKVREYPPNAFGLYDMHGNVWEWCEDSWHDSYQGAPKDGSAWINNNTDVVLRGGSWNYHPGNCRSSLRNRSARESQNNYYGFRVVCAPFPGLI
jgi:eukaryotic-like serine/threonine-protein kinase